MAKVNQQTMKTQYDGQYDTFCRKNHDYGNSFEESLDQFGIVASIVRMSDKMKRLESLTDESKTQQVGSESLLDTLEDLSNYAAMTACWLKGVREEDGENTLYADNKPVVTYIGDTSKYEADVTIGNDWEFTDAVRDVVTMLKVVFKLHCQIEEFKMTEEDYKELEHITNRLRSMVNDGTISEELMRKLIDIHVKMNPDVLLFQLFNRKDDTPATPTEVPEAIEKYWEEQKRLVDYLLAANDDKEDEKVDSFNAEFLNMAKTCLNDLFDNIILCRDQNISLPKRLTYCSYREEKYEQIAALVLTGNIDFGEVARIVNDYPNLRVAEKNHLLQSLVSAAYKISDEPENEKPEFLNKKFHIPDEILEDLKEPEEEPERKRTVLGMIFPFRL